MSTSFTYAQIVQICNYLMLSNQAFEARPAAGLHVTDPWSVMTRAGHNQPWVNYDLTNINLTAVTNFLTITFTAGPLPNGQDGPVGLSVDELKAIARYLQVTGAAKFARATDDGRVLTSPDGQQWTVYETSVEFNFPAAQAAVQAIVGH
jgi:hypothetical protein